MGRDEPLALGFARERLRARGLTVTADGWIELAATGRTLGAVMDVWLTKDLWVAALEFRHVNPYRRVNISGVPERGRPLPLRLLCLICRTEVRGSKPSWACAECDRYARDAAGLEFHREREFREHRARLDRECGLVRPDPAPVPVEESAWPERPRRGLRAFLRSLW